MAFSITAVDSSFIFTEMDTAPVLLFDGVCNLCNGAVQFVLKHDTKKAFRFASLQSGVAEHLLQPYGDLKKLSSVVLLENGNLFQKSNAVLKVINYLPWYWQWMRVFWIMPRFLRDAVYDWIAKNRYKWFGKRESCMIPTPELHQRFLD